MTIFAYKAESGKPKFAAGPRSAFGFPLLPGKVM